MMSPGASLDRILPGACPIVQLVAQVAGEFAHALETIGRVLFQAPQDQIVERAAWLRRVVVENAIDQDR